MAHDPHHAVDLRKEVTLKNIANNLAKAVMLNYKNNYQPVLQSVYLNDQCQALSPTKQSWHIFICID